MLGSLALAHYVLSHLHPAAPGVSARVHEGLLGWDAGYYEGIATKGYGALGRQALRFFPLVPLLARWMSDVTRMTAGDALIVISNACALAAGALLYHLARRETGDKALARRSAWLLALAPSAFVLVMGYSEAAMLVLGLCAFLALRSRRWWWAATMGVLLGLTRPVGLAFVVPAAIEAVRDLPSAGASERIARLGAVLSPAVGTGAYLAWVKERYNDAFLPLKVQSESGHHGGLADPFTTLYHNASQLLHGHHVGSGLHVPWVVLLIVLVVVSFRKWPASYAALALVTLVASVTSANLDSLERYALSAFPFALAGASLTASPRVERAVLTLLSAGLLGYSLLAFLNAYVP